MGGQMPSPLKAKYLSCLSESTYLCVITPSTSNILLDFNPRLYSKSHLSRSLELLCMTKSLLFVISNSVLNIIIIIIIIIIRYQLDLIDRPVSVCCF
jgi:hypothetical protein